MSAARSRAPLGGRLRDRGSSCAIAPLTCRRSRASGARIVSRVDRQLLQRRVLATRGSEHLVDLLQRRVGAPDDRVEVLAAAGDAGAELVEDQRQPLRGTGARMMLLIRSRSTDCCVFVDRQQVLALARAVRRSSRAAAAARAPAGARLRRLALDELLADQRLRAHDAARVACGSPGSRGRRSRSTTAALKSGVTSSESILPTLTPATLTSSPGITKPALSKIARTL